MVANEEKIEKRLTYLHRDWTSLYTLVTTALEKNAPVAARELHEACDLRLRGETVSAACGKGVKRLTPRRALIR